MSRKRSQERRQHPSFGTHHKCVHARWSDKADAEWAAANKKGVWQAMRCPVCGWWKLVSR